MAGNAPSLNVRVAANLAELKRNLAEGKNQIETTTAAMQKLATSLQGDKLIQNAHNITAAVQGIGGATKLTESEKARLNATLSRAIQKYDALGKEAPKAMRDLEQATRSVEPPTNAVNAKMVALGSAIGSFIGSVAYDAVRQLATSVKELVSEGLRTEAVVDSFERLSSSIGETSDVMLNATRGATKGLISDLDLMLASNKAILLGLPVTSKEMGGLAAAAVTLGKAMGQDAGKSLDDLITALGRSSPLILDNLGLTVKVGEANETYATKLGIAASALTDGQKKTAFYEAAMEAAEAKVKSLGGVQLTVADQGTRLATSFENLIHGATRFASTGLTPVNDGLTALPQGAIDAGVALGTLGAALAAAKVGMSAYAATLASGGIAAATLSSAVTGLGTALTVLSPIIVAVGGAWLGWRIGGFIGEVTGLTDAVTYLSGKLMGLSDAHLAASKAAREHAEMSESLRGSLEQVTAKGSPMMKAFADEGLKPVALSFDEITATIASMDRQLQTANDTARRIAEETRQRNAEAARLIREQMDLEAEAWNQKAQHLDFIGEREIRDAAERYTREEQARKEEQERLDENAEAHRAMLNEIGVARMNAEAARMAEAEREKDAWKTHLGDLSSAFTELSQIAGGALSDLTRGIGSMVASVELATDSVESLKSGFSSLGAGSTLKGITSIVSGIGGIVSVADTAISAVKSLWNWARGGEEGTVVNPARDAWFAGRSVQDVGDQLGEKGIDGETARQMIDRVFKAKKKTEFDAASGEIDKILRGFQHGTQGRFLDFGRGTPVVLHGKERVVTESEGRHETARVDALERELRGLRADIRRMPRQLAVAVVDAVNLA